MKYVRFGNTGMEVSRFCLGGMTFSRKIDANGTRRIVDEALDRGVNFVDTAESYTDSEDFLGRALEGRREKVYLATKVFTVRVRDGRGGRNSRANLMFSLERSLQQLRTDYVDLYQLHHPDPATPTEETLATLQRAVEQGKVRYVGVSNHYAWQMAHMVGVAKSLNFEPIVSIQCRYNILDRAVESETVPMAWRFNLALMAYAPLCGGMLTGKYRRGETSRAGTRSQDDPKLQKFLHNDAAFDVIDALKPIAAEQGVELPQLAMLWLTSTPHVTTPILGGSRPEHFRLMYDIADRELPAEVVKRIDELSSAFIYRPFENQPFADLSL